MEKTQKINFIWDTLKKSNLFNMDKVEIYYNKNEMLCIKDYTCKVFKNGIAILHAINYFKKYISIDILRPDYLIHETITINF